MAIQVKIINGKGTALDSLSGPVTSTGVDESDLMYFAQDFLEGQGVVRGIGGEFNVTETGPVSLSVDVANGSAYVARTGFGRLADALSAFWKVTSGLTENVPITSNTSGLDRIDLIVLQVDDLAIPNDNATNVATLTTVEGTPAAVPVAPATPNNSIVLARVYVGNGVTTISDADITVNRTHACLSPKFMNLRSPASRVKRNASQVISRGAPVKVDFDAVFFNYFGLYDTGTKRVEATALTAGLYTISAGFVISESFPINTAINIYILKNGANYVKTGLKTDGTSTFNRVDITDVVLLEDGDYVEIFAEVAGAGSATITGSGLDNYFSAVRNSFLGIA